MRIISVKMEPFARILTVVYALFGLFRFVLYAFRGDTYLTLPFGVLAPLFNLNVNFNLGRPSGALGNVLLGLASIIAYAVTGWITGAVFVLCFNFIAKRMGGIDAKFVAVRNGENVGA
jgi:hypothetical protein